MKKNAARNAGNDGTEKGGKPKEERVKGKFLDKIVKERCPNVETA